MDYAKMKKTELIALIESEKNMRETAEDTVEKLTRDWENDTSEIKSLKNQLYLAELTIIRLTTDETVRQELEINCG